jgi:DNA-directed RNA polymerase subunit M
LFCPKCKSLLYPKENLLICRKCGFEKKKVGKNIVINKQVKKDITIIDEKDRTNILPKIKIKCAKCDNNEAYWILRQMRGSDEPESRFYTCTKCKYKWRED